MAARTLSPSGEMTSGVRSCTAGQSERSAPVASTMPGLSSPRGPYRNSFMEFSSLFKVDDDALAACEMLQHGLEREFLPQPRLLEAAVGDVWPRNLGLVDLDVPGFQRIHGAQRAREITSPDACCQAEAAVVGESYRFFGGVERHDACDR